MAELLLVIAPHLVDDGVFAVNHFIVRQRQNKNIVVKIRHREHEGVARIIAVVGMHGQIL